MQHIAVLFLLTLFIVELIYFKIADHFNIIDHPNERSSHTKITIRGGGVIFALSSFFFFFVYDFRYPWFILGLALIAIISFIDDMVTLNNKVRLAIHLLAVGLLFLEWNLYFLPWYWLIAIVLFVIATINAYNFMDGINGIMGLYSLLTIGTLYYINRYTISFTSNEFLVIIALSLVVFNFFNFRKKAKCFAGDVGSVSIALIIIFLIGQLILKTSNFSYILLLLCYGLDTATTVAFRAIRGEHIFMAHRSHFYQFLSNEKKLPQLLVSAFYFIVQLFINFLIVFWVNGSTLLTLLLIFTSAILFIVVRFLIEGRDHLIMKK